MHDPLQRSIKLQTIVAAIIFAALGWAPEACRASISVAP